jgi:anti-sigma B factor antagonist
MATTQYQPDTRLLRVQCPEGLTLATAQSLRPQLQQHVNDGAREVVIDLSGCSVVDSSGLGLLVATHNSLAQVGGRLVVSGVSTEILNLLRITRLDKHFTVEAGRSEGP